ncbi:MAG: hypothetical protein GKR94_21025 [Gammaproteobacteria bacterium]|nr:hypothetical protein [Gammaproteobacteria bacterium]
MEHTPKTVCRFGEFDYAAYTWDNLDLFAGRTRCHRWWPNPPGLLFSSLAYTLLEALRRPALPGTSRARAYGSTIRLKRLKIAAVGLRNTRLVLCLIIGFRRLDTDLSHKEPRALRDRLHV